MPRLSALDEQLLAGGCVTTTFNSVASFLDETVEKTWHEQHEQQQDQELHQQQSNESIVMHPVDQSVHDLLVRGKLRSDNAFATFVRKNIFKTVMHMW